MAYTWGRQNIGPGDQIVLTQMEHHSNIVPWQIVAAEKGATLRWLHVDESGRISLDELDEVLAEGNVKLVAITHVSNVLGTINPVAEVAARARAAGAVCLVDGSQAVPQMPVDLHELGADFYAWTAHKALGPSGLGILHGRRELLEAMPPFLGGGHMISQVGLESSTWAELPGKFEAGTSAITEAVGLGAAVDYLAAIGMDAVRAHERDLTAYALERLPEVEGLRVFGGSRPRRPRRRDLVRAGGHPPARPGRDLRPRRRVHPRRPPLRPAVDARAGRVGNRPRQLPRVLEPRGRGSADRFPQRGARGVRALAMDALYRDYILDHYKNPRNFGTLEPHDLEHHDHNPLCGDELGVHLLVDDEGTITDLRFHGQGCAISQAAASIASEELIGMKADEIPGLERRVGVRPAGHRHLPHAAQVRPAEPQGHARRHRRRRLLARVVRSPGRPGSRPPSARSPSSRTPGCRRR